MTEKNTLSILENIKKKMQKFDQEPKKIETVASVNDEFEYIPSSKNKAADPKKDAVGQEHKDFMTTAAAKPEVKLAPLAPKDPADDFGLDDLSDLDSHHPSESKVAEVSPAKTSALEPDAHSTSADSDIFATAQDDMKDDLEIAEPTSTKVEEKLPEQKVADHSADHGDDLDFNLDLDLDLDLDDEKEEKISAPAAATNSAPVTPPAAPVMSAPVNPMPTQPAPLPPMQDLVSPMQMQTPPAAPVMPTPVNPLQNSNKKFTKNLDHIDLDELLREEEAAKNQNQHSAITQISSTTPYLEVKAPTPPVAATPTPEKKSISDELLNDANFDDLDDVETKMFSDNSTSATITAPPAPTKQQEVVAPVIETPKAAIPEIKKPEVAPDNGFEKMMQMQNFAEIAMPLLEPKLDTWLDKHLHGLVEKIVQEEVKKLFDKR